MSTGNWRVNSETTFSVNDFIGELRVAKIRAAQFIFLFFTSAVFSATRVDFYKTVSASQNTNMISMTTDLFYNQMQSLDGYTVTDKRETSYSSSTESSSVISFYAEIQESNEGSWICTLNAIKNSNGKNVSETKKYASYYKILLDAKSSLENLLASLDDSNSFPQNEDKGKNFENTSLSIEKLAGTWTGEPLVDKIVLLKGGRGFVIFKNGASMNISVTVSGNNVLIKQTGKSNASYFPEIPRNVALQNAGSAEPVEWTMTLTSQNTLSGKKSTLVSDESSSTGVSRGEISVVWNRK